MTDVSDLLDRYWQLAYAEGRQSRQYDTENGDAQECRAALDAAFKEVRTPSPLPHVMVGINWHAHCGALLAVLEYICEATGEHPDEEDAALVKQIDADWTASQAPQQHAVGGLALISAERERQIAKGYDASHDDAHTGGEIIMADWGARARIEAAINAGRSGDSPAYKELLAQAAAQCAAEIDRVERAEGSADE
jgi:hypothetical protein